jgi:hypothetical protein
MGSRQPIVGLVVLKIKQNIFFAQTATFKWIDDCTSGRFPSPV